MRKWLFLFSLIGIIAIAVFFSLPIELFSSPVHTASEPKQKMKNNRTIHTSTGKWEQVYVDEFNTGKLNTKNWNPLYREQNYNQELQVYTPSNVNIVNGQLLLTARKERKKGKRYTSGLVDTKNKYSFLYGRIEIRMKVPIRKGLLPALWLLPADDKTNLPEIDIFEAPGLEPHRFYMVNHWKHRSRHLSSYNYYDIRNPHHFHTYVLEWEKDEIRWYIDGRLKRKTTKGIPHQRMYLLMNIAVGGEWPGKPQKSTRLPVTMQVESVKIYQKKGALKQ